MGNYSYQRELNSEIDMDHSVILPLRRPLFEQWARDIAKIVVSAWQARRARRELDQRIAALAELSPAVLRDIGWPDDLLSRAAARREAQARRIDAMSVLAAYRGGDSRAC